ncbi:cytochrome c oxidase assembly factor 4 homolog, mitochondrial [Erpetoichthys calabaricus]|uniref:Cytochrome c oxidase assembly factor 4 homolog, mitochondrial n=1 Tax=Erpetoichthys calabaricus TaxID=27687 RepID=A0A8C4RSU9_ERPCA|nr:cytochrome c oxidase assembly factor 4 homolog, mitochondrial [Erpetoichthys calabaricus]XP_028657076.1 cytochrome c oxidase assembly factor 4 homolog, mitochondrial [Erpetoichthys calabaricus]
MTAPSPKPHIRTGKAEEEDDPVELMISKTGCAHLHYAVQECMAEHQDWRKCQPQVQGFKECMSSYQKSKREEQIKIGQKIP